MKQDNATTPSIVPLLKRSNAVTCQSSIRHTSSHQTNSLAEFIIRDFELQQTSDLQPVCETEQDTSKLGPTTRKIQRKRLKKSGFLLGN